MSYLSSEQLGILLRPINGRRVSKDGKGFSHVEAYEIRAHLIRVFGFARWSEDVISQDLIFETEKEGRYSVAYRTVVRLTVCAPDGTALATYTEGAVGDAQRQPSRADAHDLALKTSQSQALKRCAYNLGDAYGLSLFNRGSLNALVVKTLVSSAEASTEDVTEHITHLAPERGEEETQRETSSKQAPRNTLPQTPVEDVPGPDDLSDGTEIARATANADMVFNGTSPLDHIRNLMRFPTGMDPAMKLRVIRDAMAVATEHGLNDTRIPTGQSLSAYLTEQLQAASREIADLVKDA